MNKPIAVLGAGAWGTALAIAAHRAGHPVRLWARDPARAEAIAAARENTRYLPGQPLPEELEVTHSLDEALDGAVLGLIVVPTQHLAEQLPHLPAKLPPLLLCAKGMEMGTRRLPLEILEAIRPGQPAGVLSGPNFAHEVAKGLPAAAVIASHHAALRQEAARLLSGPGFRLYAGDDPVGAQVGGAAKNVIAIAAGAVIGAGLGENGRAALVTRGLAEIARLTVALGGKAETVAGLSGMGDLLLTCTGPGSRNFSLGLALGQGKSLEDVLASRVGVTEGVKTAPALLARARASGVELPIVEAVAAVLDGAHDIPSAVESLLGRPLRHE
ncbi:NAD(P)-dependent glycerol-3-phosphate dehydrogenase [Acetobacteraceae bacterium H6797]|nr:NAD(P)-dependent glycerol-3-phosphate dehydrogenase [Acetobacteraceae bacterium H6797]